MAGVPGFMLSPGNRNDICCARAAFALFLHLDKPMQFLCEDRRMMAYWDSFGIQIFAFDRHFAFELSLAQNNVTKIFLIIEIF